MIYIYERLSQGVNQFRTAGAWHQHQHRVLRGRTAIWCSPRYRLYNRIAGQSALKVRAACDTGIANALRG